MRKHFRDRFLRRKGAHRPHEESEHGIDLEGDALVGKRVFYHAKLPQVAIYGTIQRIVRSSTDEEYWKILTDAGFPITEPLSSFPLYENAPELHAGDRVIEAQDSGGTMRGTVKRAIWLGDELRFLIHYDDGDEYAMPPTRFQKRK